MNNIFKLNIDGADFSDYIEYPISIEEKNLTGGMDTLEITISNTSLKTPFKNNVRATLTNLLTNNTLSFILVSDTVEKMGSLEKYRHRLGLIEYVYYLTRFMSPNITITRNTNPNFMNDYYAPTIAEVLDRVLSINRREYPDMRFFDADDTTREILSQFESPEWTFEQQTLYEVVETLFTFCGLRPQFKDFRTLSHIRIYDEEIDNTNFTSLELGFDPQTKQSALVADVSNMEIERSITEPSIGYIATKSSDGFEITADNAIIETMYPIANVESIRTGHLYVQGLGMYNGVNRVFGMLVPNELFNPAGLNNDLMRDENDKLTEVLVEKQMYDLLDATVDGIGSHIYFETGKPDIKGLTVLPKYKSFWSEREHAISKIVREKFYGEPASGFWLRGKIFKSWYQEEGMDILTRYVKEKKPHIENIILGSYVFIDNDFLKKMSATSYERSGDTPNQTSITFKTHKPEAHMLSFSVSYRPYISSKIYNFRENMTEGTATYIPYSQPTNLTSNETYGSLLDKVNKANSGDDMKVRFTHKRIEDIIKPGFRFGDYIITGSIKQYYQNLVYATYSYDKYYTKLNQHIQLREKWRQFEIPTENILQQQLTIQRFGRFEYERRPHSENFKSLNSLFSPHKIDSFILATNDKTLILPAVAYNFNNSIIVDVNMASNFAIGYQSQKLTSKKQKNQPLGLKFPVEADIQFIPRQNLDVDAFEYPLFADKKQLIEDSFFDVHSLYIDKDAREQIRWSLQIHHIDLTGDVFITPNFTRYMGAVGGPGITKVKIGITDKVMSDKLTATKDDFLLIRDDRILLSPRLDLPIGSERPVEGAVGYAVMVERDGRYDILYYHKTRVLDKKLYLNYTDSYHNNELTFEWLRVADEIGPWDYSTFNEPLPTPHREGLKGKTTYWTWEKTNSTDKLTYGFVSSNGLNFPAPKDTTFAVITKHALVPSTIEKYESASMTGEVTVPENPTEQDIWYAIFNQEKQLFFDLPLAAFEETVIRVDDGFGFTYYQFKTLDSSDVSLEFYTTTPDIRYYKSVIG